METEVFTDSLKLLKSMKLKLKTTKWEAYMENLKKSLMQKNLGVCQQDLLLSTYINNMCRMDIIHPTTKKNELIFKWKPSL